MGSSPIAPTILQKEKTMTWTAILYNGDTHFKQVFYGSHDSREAIKEAQTKFGQFWPPGVDVTLTRVNVVAVIPGENPVYINEPKTIPNKQEEERREL
jgi:hypothetical protein